jgi:hypothetical protein
MRRRHISNLSRKFYYSELVRWVGLRSPVQGVSKIEISLLFPSALQEDFVLLDIINQVQEKRGTNVNFPEIS